MPRLSSAAVALLLGLLLAAPARAQIELSTDAPQVGQPVTLSLGAPADTLSITYRPGSNAPHVEQVALDGATAYRWTPSRAGVVNLRAGDATASVSVRFVRAPVGGLLIMALAGLILFGGAAFAMRLLLQSDAPPPAGRADT